MFKTLLHYITGIFSKTSWEDLKKQRTGKAFNLTKEDLNTLKELLGKDYYIILTYRNAHLTSWLIGILSFIKTRKWPDYVHVLMNVDNSKESSEFKLMEATHSGVHWSTFEQVFNVDKVCILKPKYMKIEKWTSVIDAMIKQEGKPYDDLFDLTNANAVSCVEMCRIALQAEPDYHKNFAELEKMISTIQNLTPQMFHDCSDFEIVFEVKR